MIPILGKHINADAFVVDVGANAGYFTKIFSKLAHSGKVLSFEPNPYALSILYNVVKFRQLNNVTICPCGLGSSISNAVLNTPIKKSGSLGYGLAHLGDDRNIDNRNIVAEDIVIDTLDNVLESHSIKKVDFIKIDVEGWELRVLNGAKNILFSCKPVLMIEVNESYLSRAGDSTEDLWRFLRACNYDIHKLSDNGQTELANSPIHEGDILCIPIA